MAHFYNFVLAVLIFNYGIEVEAFEPRVVLNFPGEEDNFILPPGVDIRSGDSSPTSPDDNLPFDFGLSAFGGPRVESLPSDYDATINDLSTLEDFQSYFEIGNLSIPSDNFTISTRFGGGAVPIVEELSQANCMAEETTVELPEPRENGATYFPSCVRVPRCGGCCLVPQHSCQPVQKETVQVRVIKVNSGAMTSLRRRRGRRQSQYELVAVERHLKCECGCIVKEDSCDPLIHIYNPNKCSCQCKNKEEESACYDLSTHLWDRDSCRCLCRTTDLCSTGQTFSHAECKCI